MTIKVEETRTAERTTKGRLEGTANVSLNPTNPTAKLQAETAGEISAQVGRDRTETRTGQRLDRDPRVSYKMDWWEFKEPTGEKLDGIYMGDTVAPAIDIVCNDESIEITGSVECERYEIFVDVERTEFLTDKRFFQRNPNRDKIVALLVQKTLQEESSREPTGPIVVACAIIRSSLEESNEA